MDLAESPGGKELRFRFGLSGGSLAGQVAALTFDTPSGITGRDRLAFSIRAEKPMRVSVQLRAGVGEGERWQRSVYVDTFDQLQTVYVDDLTPVGQTSTVAPTLDRIRSLLFVVDTTNSAPGVSGRIWIRMAELQR